MQLAIERSDELVAQGRTRRVRVLTFTQDGRLLGGWEGDLPSVPRELLAA